ncbi:hypothetical protein L7F22_025330 [Adiantum nelumboides]|nr:hypothetical protein [Adiantum nelumboides]
MHRLRLGITEPSDCHAKLANNSKVKCLGIIKDAHITILDVSAKVDFYVMPSKGEVYPLILGRPWLMEVNTDQKWESNKLVLQKGNRNVYDMKLGKQSICFERSTYEKSSDESSYGDEESYTVEVTAQKEPILKERLRKMLAKDLTKEEEEDYINMFKRYPYLFITNYSMIKGVDVIQHHIDLKLDAKPVALKLRRLGVVQQEALLSEVNKLLKAGFTYRVTNFEWVSPVVVTPKKNGPLPRISTGKQYILIANDYMTRWAEAASVACITATEVRKFVHDYIYSRFRTPLEILFDRGLGFREDLLDALLENLSIKHVHSMPFYPQCNGHVENKNGVLCKIITKHVRDRPQDWDKHLTAALWAYRTSFKVSTQSTPYHLVYGQEALLPIEVELGSLQVLAKDVTSSKEKHKQRIVDLQRLELDKEAATDYYITQANKKRELFNNKVKEKKLEEGMLVMRYDSRLDLSHIKKFLQRWEGPYAIFRKFQNGSYWLQDLSGKVHKYPVNGWRLKEFFQRIQSLNEGQSATKHSTNASPMKVMPFGLGNYLSTFQGLVEALSTNEEDNELSLDA